MPMLWEMTILHLPSGRSLRVRQQRDGTVTPLAGFDETFRFADHAEALTAVARGGSHRRYVLAGDVAIIEEDA